MNEEVLGYGGNVAAEPKKISPMEEALAYVSRNIDYLNNEVDRIHVKLSPVLTEVPRDVDKKDVRTSGGLVNEIKIKGDSIKEIAETIKYISDCLDL